MRKLTTSMTLVGVVLLTVVSVAPVSAVSGWSGPTYVLKDDYALGPSMVLRGGVTHVAYLHFQGWGSDKKTGLFYATNGGGSWHTERVPTRQLPAGYSFYQSPSLAVDRAGNAHIAFARLCTSCESGVSEIWVANNVTGSWDLEQITSDEHDAAPSATFSGDDLWVAWNRYGEGIFVAYNVLGTWYDAEHPAIDMTDRCVEDVSPSLVVEGSGVPWVAYEHVRRRDAGCHPDATRGIRVARPQEGGWEVATITTDARDTRPHLALDTNGLPHLIFERAGAGIEYTRLRQNLTWAPAVLASGGGDASLAVDAAGNAHIGYKGVNGRLRYATNRTGAWAEIALTDYAINQMSDNLVAIALTNTGKARVLFARTEIDLPATDGAPARSAAGGEYPGPNGLYLATEK